MKRTFSLLVSLMLIFPAGMRAADKRPMTIDDLFRFERVADPQISPDGKMVAYVVTTADLPGNKTSSSIWLASSQDGKPRPLTNTTKKDSHPRWSPDGKQILFESNRSGEGQLWVIDVNGGEARQLTTISSEAGNGLWSPDGKWIAFVSAVYPEYSDKPFTESDALNKKRKEEIEKNPVKAKVFTKLFFRHWNEWVEDKRQHLFVVEVTDQAHGMPSVGLPRDVTPGDRDANPTSDTFATSDDFTFSPDSKYLLYTAPPEKNEAWNTNYDICRVPVAGGAIECLTKDNPAADGAPAFSPDGKKLAYRAQKRPGFESDKWDLLVVDSDSGGAFQSSPRNVTAALDQSVSAFVWGPNDVLEYIADNGGASGVFHLAAGPEINGVANPGIKVGKMTGGPAARVGKGTSTVTSLSASRDFHHWAYSVARISHPPRVYITHFNTEGDKQSIDVSGVIPANDILTELDLPQPESVTLPGAGGTPMQMWILKPPGFDPKKKWPLAFLVHGGPQGAWEDGWSYRWNPELWAAQGYVVALPNPRGSTGFGQRYVEEISGDWGGKCFDDLMAGLAYLEKQPYIDPERMAAAGASFGGYMMNWFQGHTNKFKTLITHCGVYNFDSMYALTDELWFDEWEHGGPPWVNRESYEKYSPHRFVKNFKTPMLIIHNDLDFRVPVAEGFQLFTTLQRLGIPSKMINFPDEGHWVLKPQNSAYWHKEVFAWLAKYVPPGGK
ncbi:MAG TPA: S9 family peptidase [Gemmataceae bacterium]|nr:S9 family peptidase [Gemmataceae bacterium]